MGGCMNVRLHGCFTLKSPLSHIGESLSTTAFLAEEPIIQRDGSIESVFSYSGNAWRGQLRDMAAAYLIEKLGSKGIPESEFELVFSGGKIGGEQKIDINARRQWRQLLPPLALLGGNLENQPLPGKVHSISNCYPICREAIPCLPRALHEQAAGISYRGLTFEKSFSRKDDTKDERLSQYLALPAPANPPASVVASLAALPGFEAQPAQSEPPKPERKQQPTQMRMTVELVAAGVRLYSEIVLLAVNEVELGALVSAIHRWGRSPHLGGQAGKGHGLVDLAYEMIDLDTGALSPFLSVEDGLPLLSEPAADAKQAYDAYCRELYDRYLHSKATELRQLLGAS